MKFREIVCSRTDITEASTPAPLFSDQVITKAAELMLNNVDWSDGAGVGILLMAGLNPETVDPKSRAAKAKLMTFAKERCVEAAENFDWLLHQASGRLTIWRQITAPPNWQPDPTRHPGIYWSWQKDAVEAHWGSFRNGDVKWLLTAKVIADQIDWVSTLAANAHVDYDNEKEVTLRDDSQIEFTHERV